jgi:hypothetical protein
MSYINNFIEKSGKYNYAYVSIIINNDIYANPAIIFAESLKKVGCMCDIIALIDNRITDQTIFLLKNFFNKIIKIDLIEINNTNPIQKVILTKINVFKMIEYNKIFLIDVDTIIFTNLDKYFLQTRDTNDEKKIYMPDIDNYGFILISPSIDIYNKCLKLISKCKNNPPKDFNKPFDYIMNKIYTSSNIKKLDITISYDVYLNVDCIQYRKDKPFLMKSEFTIDKRQRLDHFKVWFSYLSNIINKYPEIKKYSCINESLMISKYFLAGLSRFVIEFVKSNKNKKLQNVINVYGMNKYSNLDYYHLDLTKEYTNKFIKYDVDTFDIKSFLEYIDNEKKIFVDYYNCVSVKKLILELEKKKNLLYIFLNNYIKMFSSVFITIEIYSDEKLVRTKIPIDLKNNLIYVKQYNFKNFLLKNIIFNLYQNLTYEQRIKYIEKNLNKSEYTLVLCIYETISPIIDYDYNSNLELFIFYEQSSKIRLSSIFFNPNTLNHYNILSSDVGIIIFNSNIKKNNMGLIDVIKILYLQTLKKFIFSVYTGDEIINLGVYFEDYNKIMIVDNNKHLVSKIKQINTNKVFFITILFSKQSQYKNLLKEKNININVIYDINKHWEFEGIKIIQKVE